MDTQSQNLIKTVLCLEIGGTFSRGAIFNVNLETKEISRHETAPSFKAAINGPNELVAKVKSTFPGEHRELVKEISIASFGPLDLDSESSDYGKLLSVPSEKKKGWKDQSIVTLMKAEFPNIKVRIMTDVNASAYAEYIQRQGKIKTSIAYITIGTGVGVGLVINKKPVIGFMHPEGGHIPLSFGDNKPNPEFNSCSWHTNCVEGYSTSVFAQKTLGLESVEDLKDHSGHPVFETIARNIGQLCATVCLLTSVEKIIIGGGVSRSKGFLKFVNEEFSKQLNGYVKKKDGFQNYIELCADYDSIGMRGAAYLVFDE